MNKVAEFVGIPYLKRLISNQSEQPELASSPTRNTLKSHHLPGTLQHLKTSPPRRHFVALSNLATFQHSHSHLPEATGLAARRKSVAPCSKGLSNFAPWTSQQRTLKPRKEHTLKSLKAMRGGRRPPNAGPPRARKSPRAAKLPRASHSRASHSRASLSLPKPPIPEPRRPSRAFPRLPKFSRPISTSPNPNRAKPEPFQPPTSLPEPF